MSSKLSPKQIAIILGGVGLLIFVSFLFSQGNRQAAKPPDVKLTMWGPFDEGQTLQTIIDAYKKVRPSVDVQYKPFKEAGYHDALLNALAAGTGPDIFFVRNSWIPKEKGKLASSVADNRCATYGVVPTGLTDVRFLFPTAVEQDFVSDGEVFALPLYLDTLALLYNKNSFDQAALAEPPSTWQDFQQIVPYLRTLNQSGQIVKAAGAIGGTDKSVPNAADLFALLIMQNGAQMTDAAFSRATFNADEKGNRGLKAFNFYLQFGNAASPYYTWNDDQPYALDGIGSGKVAMLFGYYEDLKAIRRKSPLAGVGVAPMLQVEGAEDAMTIPSYWGLAASKQGASPCWAWDFIMQFTTDPQLVKSYTDATNRLPALRTMIAERVNDVNLGIFARQALTARSWHRADEDRTKQIVNEVITAVLRGQLNSAQALRQAEDQITELMIGQYKQ